MGSIPVARAHPLRAAPILAMSAGLFFVLVPSHSAAGATSDAASAKRIYLAD